MSDLTLHSLLPLAALLLNIALAALVLVRNAQSPLSRVFAGFLAGVAVWNAGVFMLRGSPDPGDAYFWEIVIHVGVAAVPAFYFHFVLQFLDGVSRQRRALGTVYAASALFALVALAAPSVLMGGVTRTVWGWAPAPGPLYAPFFLYFNGVIVWGLWELLRAYARMTSSFQRNRAQLIVLGTCLSLGGGIVDFLRFILARIVPAADQLYPVGIPANMAFVLLLATSIVRYRMFDVSLALKRTALYTGVGVVLTALLAAVTWLLGRRLDLGLGQALWIVAPFALAMTLLLTPVGVRLEDLIRRMMLSRRHGCYDTLLALSKQMGGILELERLVDTLLRGLVRGIPLTHGVLMLRDETTAAFVTHRREAALDPGDRLNTLAASSPVVRWLEAGDDVLVTEEARIDPRLAELFADAGDELHRIPEALIVPLKAEGKLIGVLRLGEKLSGEIFEAEELEVLALLATQAAIALENARLYEQATRARRRVEVLYDLSRRLATVPETGEILHVVVHEAARLLGADAATLRVLEGEDLVLRAQTASAAAFIGRPVLKVGESLAGRVVAVARPLAVEDVVEDSRYDPAHQRAARETGIHGFLGVPIQIEGAVVGTLNVYTKSRRSFLEEEISLLSALGDQASVAIQRDRLAAERRRAEEALLQSEKLATMGELLAGVAHELNNPLSVIVGYSQLLRRDVDDARLAERADHIADAAHRSTRIVRNFLALARKRPPERQRVALGHVIEEALELLAYPLKVDSVELVRALDPAIPELWADPHQLQQVIVNLVSNAHQALRRVSPPRRITVSTRPAPARGRAVIEVADSGPGIPPEIQARVFEPFFTTKPVGEGTGLGLSLCQSIVESHGGTIRLESAAGRGTTFTIELPLDTPHPVAPPKEAEPAPVRGRTVLVVDDEPIVLSLLTECLAVDGHQVDAVASALTALERLRERAYDIIVSDIRMPELDGPGFYREVGRVHPGGRPPFVFMTGDSLSDDTRHFLEEAGIVALAKPFLLDDLRRALVAALADGHDPNGLRAVEIAARPQRP